jgi:lysophospholipid acyltransferase (LPLAT)-like uncharacterized protein
VKRPLRAAPVQRLLAWLVTAYVKLIIATLRWRVENPEVVSGALASPEGAIILFWHGRIAHALACSRLLGERPRRALISLSRDGAFIAMAAERLGVPAIRGSTAPAGRVFAKGGADAFRRAISFIHEGGMVLVTPDGPRGPDQVVSPGPVLLAHLGQRPVFLMGLAARPSLAMNSWDHARIPAPFARGCAVFEGPLHAPAEADEAALEYLRADWQARLRAAQARAEEILAHSPRRD